jgi:NAD(P)-dependent dehydrogenase (short-subunit alcohol dehydrogenase family)
MGRLDSKVAAVTGGASGIGEATVGRFVGEGASVAFCDRDGERGQRVAAAHGEHEKRTGQPDPNWPDWYADYIVREQAGTEPANNVLLPVFGVQRYAVHAPVGRGVPRAVVT